MVTRIGSATGVISRGPTKEDFWFEPAVLEEPHIITPPTQTTYEVLDRVYQDIDPGEWRDDRRIVTDVSSTHPKFTCLDPAVAEVSQLGKVTPQVTKGTARVRIDYPLLSRLVTLSLNSQDSPATTQTGWTQGSFGRALSDRASFLSEASPESSAMFLVRNPSAKEFIRSPSCWCPPITSQSVWGSGSGYKWPLHKVTPRHVLFAAHVTPVVDRVYYWVTESGHVYDRMLVGRVYHPTGADIGVGLLDAELPEDVATAQILPGNFLEYTSSEAFLFPLLTVNQEGNVGYSQIFRAREDYIYRIPAAGLTDLFLPLAWGDSSVGEYIALPGKGWSLAFMHTGYNSGASLHSQVAGINEMIASVDALHGIDTGYQLTEYDLSAFPTYD